MASLIFIYRVVQQKLDMPVLDDDIIDHTTQLSTSNTFSWNIQENIENVFVPSLYLMSIPPNNSVCFDICSTSPLFLNYK